MPVTSCGSANLSRNLTALSRHDPVLADEVRRAPAIDPAFFEASRAGPPTARLPDTDARLVQLASRIDPQREARRLIEAHLAPGPVVYVVAGLGLGYHVAELLARRGPEDCVLVGEGNLALIRSALERFDFSVKEINQFDNPELFFHRQKGVFVFAVKHPGNAANAALHPHDIILKLDGKEVETLKDIKQIHERLVADVDRRHRTLIVVLRGSLMRQVVLDFARDYSKE